MQDWREKVKVGDWVEWIDSKHPEYLGVRCRVGYKHNLVFSVDLETNNRGWPVRVGRLFAPSGDVLGSGWGNNGHMCKLVAALEDHPEWGEGSY